MQEYARKTLQDMLGSAASSPDVARILGSSLVDEAVLESLLPAMVGFLAMGLSLGSRARTEGAVAIGAAEKVLHTDGREVMRLLLQGLTDLAGGQEERLVGGVLGSDGALRSRVETGHTRQVATTVGEITAGRMAYRAPGAGNLHPLDEVLSLPADLHSDGLTELCALEAARGSFASTTQSVERATGVRIGTRQVIGLVRRAARDAGAFYSGRDQDTVPTPQDVLVITADGKGVVVRPDALREGTAKAAKKSGTSSGNRKRMAEVACVYDLTPVPRTVDDIIAPTGTDPADHEAVPSPTAVNKWLTASIIENIPTVIAAALDEAERRDPTHARTWIALIDGNTTQINAIIAEARRRNVQVTLLIDFLHVSGYVWDAAKAFFCTDTTTGMTLARTWVAERNRLILAGGATEVAAQIRARSNDSTLTPNQRKTTDAAATYLENKAPYLDYPTALASGWPIATGVIEGACRHLVADRMDITGSRWGLETAQAVLTLRAIITTGDFEAYWAFHTRQEHRRNHSSIAHYQHEHTLAA